MNKVKPVRIYNLLMMKQMTERELIYTREFGAFLLHREWKILISTNLLHYSTYCKWRIYMHFFAWKEINAYFDALRKRKHTHTHTLFFQKTNDPDAFL